MRAGQAHFAAPSTGTYSMTLVAQGVADLKIDGKTVIHVAASSDQPTGGSIDPQRRTAQSRA